MGGGKGGGVRGGKGRGGGMGEGEGGGMRKEGVWCLCTGGEVVEVTWELIGGEGDFREASGRRYLALERREKKQEIQQIRRRETKKK